MVFIKSRLAGGLPEVDNLALAGGLHVMIFIGRKCVFDLSIRTWSKTINNINDHDQSCARSTVCVGVPELQNETKAQDTLPQCEQQ